MAFAITNRAINLAPDFLRVGQSTSNQYVSTATSTSGASPYFEFADYTSTGPIPLTTQMNAGGIGDFLAPRQGYQAFIYFKNFTTGATSTGTVGGPVVTLECATSTSFTGNFYVIDSKMLPGSTTTSTGFMPSVSLSGVVPVVGGAQYARVNFYGVGISGFAGSSSTGLDCIIQAV